MSFDSFSTGGPEFPADLQPPPQRAAGIAAVLTWAIGGIICFLGCCCTSVFGFIGGLPPAELEKLFSQPGAQLPPDVPLHTLASVAPWIALGSLLVLLVPGVAYLVLAFWVRRGIRWAIVTVIVMMLTHMLATAMYTVLNMVVAIMQRSPATMTVTVIFFGTPVLIMGAGVYWLVRALSAPGQRRDVIEQEPWNQGTV